MAARRPFWKWHYWKSIGFCLWPPSTCIWNLKLKFQSKLDLCSGNHVVYRQTDGQTDGRTDGRTRWIQYTPPPTSLGGGINIRKIRWNRGSLFDRQTERQKGWQTAQHQVSSTDYVSSGIGTISDRVSSLGILCWLAMKNPVSVSL